MQEEERNLVRLQKFMASCGVASRRKAEQLMLERRVKVDGIIIDELGFKIDPKAVTVKVDDEVISLEREKCYIMLNKPMGYISSSSDQFDRPTVLDLIKGEIKERVFSVGRLDYETEGLLILTNDGDLAFHLTHPTQHDQIEAMTMGTRIVVMKDGIIQQIDTPSNLYAAPLNMFVAGFIGSPQMNFINAKLVKEANGMYLEFGEFKVKLPDGKVADLTEYVGKEVVMGIRPENIHDEEAFLANSPETIVEAKVDLIELLGAETNLYLTVAGNSLTARVNPRTKAKHNDTLKVAFDANKIHLFDKDTELTILN